MNTSRVEQTYTPPSTRPAHRKVVAFAIDAPNHELLVQWIEQGHLPNLGKLRQRSREVGIQSAKQHSNEHAWIPILTGRRRDRWNHWLDHWEPASYQFAEASLFHWIHAPLFYALGNQRRVIAFDMAAPVVAGVNGIQVSGFASELNECFPQSAPPELIQQLIERYGPDPKLGDAFPIANQLAQCEGISWKVPSNYQPEAMNDMTRALIRSVERRTAACRDLMRQESWNLFLLAYSEMHTAGHLLWHLSQPHPLSLLRQDDQDPLLAVYQAVDQSIGVLLQELDADTSVVFFSLDATVPDCLENARSVFLPEFLYRWNFPGKAALASGEYGKPAPPLRIDYTRHWKEEVWQLRTLWGDAEVDSPTAQEARKDPLNWCPANWYAPLWPSMKAFALPSVADGYIRLNVRGRESRGCIDPADFSAIGDELAKAIGSLVDGRSGEPLVREVIRIRDDAFDTDPRKMPADLLVVFQEEHPVDVADSPLIGRIGPIPYFRSSTHQSHGAILQNLMLISGPDIKGQAQAEAVGAPEDIPATILALLGLDIPAELDGVSRL